MAYRKIHDNFWTDPDIEALTPEQKYFYLYLLTNPSVNQLGLYEFSVRRACFETGYNQETVCKLLDLFEEKGKIKRSSTTKELLIVKFYHHNKSNSPKVIKHIEGLIEEIKDRSLIQYVYGIDTVSQEEKEEQEEKKKNKPNSPPSLQEVEEYFLEKGYPESLAETFFKYYQQSMEDCNGQVWKDSNGKSVKNWKQKAIGVWMKDENKIKDSNSILRPGDKDI